MKQDDLHVTSARLTAKKLFPSRSLNGNNCFFFVKTCRGTYSAMSFTLLSAYKRCRQFCFHPQTTCYETCTSHGRGRNMDVPCSQARSRQDKRKCHHSQLQ